ncbi:kinase-like domain-containing protein [Rhizophagus clarus]|uniref:Kinase-like domain-containing protein n=1 Tax=Rhizophagus clarus TaxID=94130 RepID=A0A8H3LCK9_9GLOM|nr:kinase-like domain-containing protein [Rhizophagus clarus]
MDLTSGNEKINDFIQKAQLQINYFSNTVLEWIPYSQLSEIKEQEKIISDFNREVALKSLHNSQNPIEFVINEAKNYLSKMNKFHILYGISQNPVSNNYILVFNWTSGNDQIDYFIQKRQLEIKNYDDIVFEWVPSNQLNQIKEINNNSLATVYSAIWRDGPLYYNCQYNKYTRDSNKGVTLKILHNLQKSCRICNKRGENDLITVHSAIWKDGPLHCDWDWNQNCYKYTRDLNKEVTLKILHNSQNLVKFVINEAKEYSKSKFHVLYGISQNPASTYDYILVQKHLTWISKNELTTVYSAIWRDGPLYYHNDEYTRDSNKRVALKFLHNLQNPIEFVISEAKEYSMKNNEFHILFGISQNSDTNDYIFVFDWSSGNKNIDDFIQKRQSEIVKFEDAIFKWIPYNQFDQIKEVSKNSLMTGYSAIWVDDPIYCNNIQNIRNSNKVVALKFLHNSQNSIEFVINEAKKYPIKNNGFLVLYGISQNPYTNDYILVQKNFTWISGNEKINDFIQEKQLEIKDYNDIVFEWIPYNQFDEINMAGNGGFSKVYSAIWEDGPLYLNIRDGKYRRDSRKKVALKCLNNSQNLITELLHEVDAYSTKPIYNSILKVYGISQDPDTKDFIIVLQYAEGGDFNNWININDNYKFFNWKMKIQKLHCIANGLKEIHKNQLVHRDFHIRNILLSSLSIETYIYISDMGLSGRIGDKDETNIYGVMPYQAPEVLRGKPYTQAADIYSFGMIMYFVATGRQPFKNCAHDHHLVLSICKGDRPEINESEAPKCYINLMKKWWDPNPNNRPDVTQLLGSLLSISTDSLYEAEIEEAENYRILHLPLLKEGTSTCHPQAIYTSRLLNPFTENLPKYIDDISECLDCTI